MRPHPVPVECSKCRTVGERPVSVGLPDGWGTLTVKRTSTVQTFRDLCPACLRPITELAG